MWFWFVVGLILTICGIFVTAADYYLEFFGVEFDNEIIGVGLTCVGAVLAILMLMGLGINWVYTVGT